MMQGDEVRIHEILKRAVAESGATGGSSNNRATRNSLLPSLRARESWLYGNCRRMRGNGAMCVAEQRGEPSTVLPQIVLLFDAPASALGNGATLLGIAQQALDRRCQGGGVLRRHQHSTTILQGVRNPGHVGGHDRRAERHRLTHDI